MSIGSGTVTLARGRLQAPREIQISMKWEVTSVNAMRQNKQQTIVSSVLKLVEAQGLQATEASFFKVWMSPVSGVAPSLLPSKLFAVQSSICNGCQNRQSFILYNIVIRPLYFLYLQAKRIKLVKCQTGVGPWPWRIRQRIFSVPGSKQSLRI